MSQSVREQDRGSTQWQRSLRDFFIGLFLVLTLVVIAITSAKFLSVKNDTSLQPDIYKTTSEQLSKVNDESLRVRSMMELTVAQSRYQQAALLLRTRTDLGYMGFISGLTMAILGSALVLGQFREESPIAVSGTVGGGRARLVSASPGLILAIAGLTFAAVVQFAARPVEVEDVAVYLANTSKLPPPAPLPSSTDKVIESLK